MFVSEAVLDYVGRRISQLEQNQLDRAKKVDSLLNEEAQLEDDQAADADALRRAEAPLPRLDICPRCWIEDGQQSELVATSMDVPEEVPEGHDILRCEQRFAKGIECQWYAIVEP